MVRIFPNVESCLRPIQALAVEIHEGWLEERRYLSMDLLVEHKRELLRQLKEMAYEEDVTEGPSSYRDLLSHNLTDTISSSHSSSLKITRKPTARKSSGLLAHGSNMVTEPRIWTGETTWL